MDTHAASVARRHAILGVLARPAQHEINNLLTVMLANLDLLRRSTPEGAQRRQIDRIGEAVRRFEASSRAILSLARRPVDAPGPFAPAASIAAIRPLLALLLPAPGALEIASPPAPWPLAAGGAAPFEDALLGCAAALGADGRMTIAFAETSDLIAVDVTLSGDAVAAGYAALGMAPVAGSVGGGAARIALPRHPATDPVASLKRDPAGTPPPHSQAPPA